MSFYFKDIFLKSGLQRDSDDVRQFPFAKDSLNFYVTECLKQNTLFAKELYGLYNTENIYEAWIENNLKECTGEYGLFKDSGYKVEEGDVDADVEISPDSIFVKISYPIKLSKSEEILELNEFQFRIPVSIEIRTENGLIKKNTFLKSSDGRSTLFFSEDTTVKDYGGASIDKVAISVLDNNFDGLDNKVVIGSVVYEGTPDGAIFDPPIKFTVDVLEEKIPKGYPPEELKLGWWDRRTGLWRTYETQKVEKVTYDGNTYYQVVALVDHFTEVAVVDCGSQETGYYNLPVLNKFINLIEPSDRNRWVENLDGLIEYCSIVEFKEWNENKALDKKEKCTHIQLPTTRNGLHLYPEYMGEATCTFDDDIIYSIEKYPIPSNYEKNNDFRDHLCENKGLLLNDWDQDDWIPVKSAEDLPSQRIKAVEGCGLTSGNVDDELCYDTCSEMAKRDLFEYFTSEDINIALNGETDEEKFISFVEKYISGDGINDRAQCVCNNANTCDLHIGSTILSATPILNYNNLQNKRGVSIEYPYYFGESLGYPNNGINAPFYATPMTYGYIDANKEKISGLDKFYQPNQIDSVSFEGELSFELLTFGNACSLKPADEPMIINEGDDERIIWLDDFRINSRAIILSALYSSNPFEFLPGGDFGENNYFIHDNQKYVETVVIDNDEFLPDDTYYSKEDVAGERYAFFETDTSEENLQVGATSSDISYIRLNPETFGITGPLRLGDGSSEVLSGENKIYVNSVNYPRNGIYDTTLWTNFVLRIAGKGIVGIDECSTTLEGRIEYLRDCLNSEIIDEDSAIIDEDSEIIGEELCLGTFIDVINQEFPEVDGTVDEEQKTLFLSRLFSNRHYNEPNEITLCDFEDLRSRIILLDEVDKTIVENALLECSEIIYDDGTMTGTLSPNGGSCQLGTKTCPDIVSESDKDCTCLKLGSDENTNGENNVYVPTANNEFMYCCNGEFLETPPENTISCRAKPSITDCIGTYTVVNEDTREEIVADLDIKTGMTYFDESYFDEGNGKYGLCYYCNEGNVEPMFGDACLTFECSISEGDWYYCNNPTTLEPPKHFCNAGVLEDFNPEESELKCVPGPNILVPPDDDQLTIPEDCVVEGEDNDDRFCMENTDGVESDDLCILEQGISLPEMYCGVSSVCCEKIFPEQVCNKQNVDNIIFDDDDETPLPNGCWICQVKSVAEVEDYSWLLNSEIETEEGCVALVDEECDNDELGDLKDYGEGICKRCTQIQGAITENEDDDIFKYLSLDLTEPGEEGIIFETCEGKYEVCEEEGEIDENNLFWFGGICLICENDDSEWGYSSIEGYDEDTCHGEYEDICSEENIEAACTDEMEEKCGIECDDDPEEEPETPEEEPEGGETPDDGGEIPDGGEEGGDKGYCFCGGIGLGQCPQVEDAKDANCGIITFGDDDDEGKKHIDEYDVSTAAGTGGVLQDAWHALVEKLADIGEAVETINRENYNAKCDMNVCEAVEEVNDNMCYCKADLFYALESSDPDAESTDWCAISKISSGSCTFGKALISTPENGYYVQCGTEKGEYEDFKENCDYGVGTNWGTPEDIVENGISNPNFDKNCKNLGNDFCGENFECLKQGGHFWLNPLCSYSCDNSKPCPDINEEETLCIDVKTETICGDNGADCYCKRKCEKQFGSICTGQGVCTSISDSVCNQKNNDVCACLNTP
jgi:hypothetical protein